jgi:hypothetical protein
MNPLSRTVRRHALRGDSAGDLRTMQPLEIDGSLQGKKFARSSCSAYCARGTDGRFLAS